MNEQIGAQIKMDTDWSRKQAVFDRLVIRLFRGTINRVFKNVICRAAERGHVGSMAFHQLAGICDRILWPERHGDEPVKLNEPCSVCGALATGVIDGRPRCCATCAFNPLGCRCKFGDPPDTPYLQG